MFPGIFLSGLHSPLYDPLGAQSFYISGGNTEVA
jgi:hypothetical protein